MSAKKQWCENDHLWEAIESNMLNEKLWEDAVLEVDKILEFLQLESGEKVLDLCCGPGRHSLELARRGFLVTGVDRTALYLNKAKEKALAEKLRIEFVLEDMRKFVQPNTFDGAIMMFSSFGYFENLDEERKVVDNIYGSLKKGGRFVLELMGKEILARIYQARDWVEKKDSIMLYERIPAENWTYLDNRWILIKDGKKEEFHLRLRLYSAFEISSLLKEAGFSEISIYGDLDGSNYDNKAKRLIAVAQK